MKKIVKYIKTYKLKSIIGLGVILSLLVVSVSLSLAEPTPNYSFIYNSTGTNNNYSNNDPGSFSLNKKIEWVGHNKLKVTMTVTSKPTSNSNGNDILLVVDTSSFLDSDMLDDLKQNLTSSVSYINNTDSTSRVGIVSFSDSYTKYNFTNDLSTIESNISSLTIGGGRSYYKAFEGIDDILTNRDTTRGLRIVFITTGLSNLNKAGDPYKYELVNNKYHLNMDCIYYLTNSVLDQPSNYFSKELVASQDTLETNINSLALASNSYTNFTIVDRYDTSKFSLVGNLNDYNGSSAYTNYGSLAITNAGIINWIMESNDDRPFFTGTTAKLEYELNYTGETGNYNLNNSNINVSKTIDQTTDNFLISDSLVIGNSYNVTYTANAPNGCSPSGIPASSHKDVYEAVTYPTDPTCSGYKFAGWKVTTQVVKTSKNGFVMPASNVEVKATWSKISIVKSMAGDVREVPKAYDLFEEEASKTNGVVKDYDTFFAGNGYSHQDAYDGSGNKKIYFFRYTKSGDDTIINNMNNVIFAGHCWQMLRTTDTGGIKMIYNGEPAVEETGHEECQTNRGGHVGYDSLVRKYNVSSDTQLAYASDYKYINGQFVLQNSNIASISDNLIGKYICYDSNTVSTATTCSTLALIESYIEQLLRILKFTNNSHYSQFGKVFFNKYGSSPADIGYMYNTRYEYKNQALDTTAYYFGSGYSYDYNPQTNQYEYSLTDEEAKDYTDDITTTHYTCWKTTPGGTCVNLSYVYHHRSNQQQMYYINLSDGKGINNALNEMLYADNVNTYDSTIKFAIDKWYEHYILPYPEFTSKLENAVFCSNRSILNLGGWSPTGSEENDLLFSSSNSNNNLNCSNLTDRFSADSSNTKAKLKYPVGLMTLQEMNLLNNDYARRTGEKYWLISPYHFQNYYSRTGAVLSYGYIGGEELYYGVGLRPAVSLAAGTKFTSGNGSMSEPYRLD